MPQSARDYLTLLLSMLIVVASARDIISDLGHGAPYSHVLQESLLLSVALGLLVWIGFDLRRQRRRLASVRAELEQARAGRMAPVPQVEQARVQLRDAVNEQFQAWELSPSEAEVGWLLLKGLSVKEIAALRGTHEKTARQQASAIYRKANLAGRHAFSAWFIEDLI